MYPAFLVILLVTGNIGRGVRNDKEDMPNLKCRKHPLILKLNHLMFTRAYKLTSYSLLDPVDNTLATNVSYSVGHLTSIL
jgi:hypothetical protein